MLGLHNLPSTKGKQKTRAGRGNSSGAGNYSGRGMKGQRSRSGGKGGLKLRGLKQSLMSVPKRRGFNSNRPVAQPVNLGDLETAFSEGAIVDTQALKAKGLITDPYAPVKILGNGELKKKLTVQVQKVSKSAQEAITAAGGTFEEVQKVHRSTKKSGNTEQKA